MNGKKRLESTMKIHYFTPYNIHKNITKGLNDSCELVTNHEDWIVIRDMDTVFLLPDSGTEVFKTLVAYGDQYGILGCWTNRLNQNSQQHQLHGGKCSDNFNLLDHIEIAKEYRDLSVNEVPHGKVIAGFFMAFQKKTYDLVNGFDGRNIVFDVRFCEKVIKSGKKLGIMNNLYLFHSYRPWAKINPETNSGHLI